MKRFYKTASTAPAANGFAVLLDGRSVKTPGGKPLALPTEKLADAIAAEWAGQGDEIVPTAMPLLRLANTVIDGIAPDPAATVAAILRFGDNDLLCYRAHQPPELAHLQAQAWDPWLEWAARTLDARLTVGDGLGHIEQPPAALATLRQKVETLDPFSLGALHVIASISGSLVLGLAVIDGARTGAEAFNLSRIDENYQAAKWGEDAEASRRAAALALELDKAAELIAALH